MHLFHRDLGGAGNPPLIVLHGLLGSSRNWQTAGAALATHFHVHALDLRNHGRSPHAATMTYEEMMGDVLEWMDEHQVSTGTLLGHSMGGKTAMLLACRHPERVRRLLVVDIAPKDYTWNTQRALFAAMTELNLADLHSRAEAEVRFESRVRDWGLRKFLATNLERTDHGHWRWIVNVPVITASVTLLEGNPLRAEDRYAGPTCFITGADSDYVEASDSQAIARHFPAAHVVGISAAGHNPHMEARADFVRAVLMETA